MQHSTTRDRPDEGLKREKRPGHGDARSTRQTRPSYRRHGIDAAYGSYLCQGVASVLGDIVSNNYSAKLRSKPTGHLWFRRTATSGGKSLARLTEYQFRFVFFALPNSSIGKHHETVRRKIKIFILAKSRTAI